MGKKWGSKQWYEYHKSNAAEVSDQKYASSEKTVLDSIDNRISELQKEQKRLSATLFGWSGLLTLFVPNQTTREILVVRKNLEELYLQRTKFFQASREAIDKAASRGISEYQTAR